MRDLGKRAAKSHSDCVLPFLDRNYVPARQERKREAKKKKKFFIFIFEISKGIELFFLMMMMMMTMLLLFFFRRRFFLELCFPLWFSFSEEGRKKRAGRLKI